MTQARMLLVFQTSHAQARPVSRAGSHSGWTRANITDVTATAAGPLMVMEDLTQTLWDPTRSLTFHYSCPDNANGSCGNDVVVVDIYASANVPAQINQVTPSFGHLVCTQPANGGSVMVPQKALAALLGCKANGTTCDNALMSVRTMILRFTPAPQQDQNGDAITAGAGHGAYAVNPR